MKELILPFITPPGAFIALFFVFSVIIARRSFKFGVFMLVCACLAWVVSTPAFARALALNLVARIEGRALPDPSEIDMIVVLTGGSYYAGDFGWFPKMQTYRRLAVAYNLQDQIGSRVPILISGGHTRGLKNPSEARVGYAFMSNQSARFRPVVLEESSVNTYENALQSAALLQKREAEEIILVTSETHMLRALAAFRGRGVDAVPYPVAILPRGKLRFNDYLPTAEGVHLTSNTLYEIYGIISYLISGKIKMSDLTYAAPQS